MGLRLDCPNCGSRPYTEFWYFGELRLQQPDESADDEFRRVWMRDNLAGEQLERWFHFAGCRRCFNVRRNTLNNHIE